MPAAETWSLRVSERRADRAHRRIPDRDRGQRVQPARASLNTLAPCAQPRREPCRAGHDDRSRPARLFQRSRRAHGRFRAFSRDLSGLARQGDLSADHAEEPLRDPGIRRDGAYDQRSGRAYQWHLWGSRMDPHSLCEPRLQPQRSGRALPVSAGRTGHTAARRHESRGQGIHCRAGF